MNGLTRITERLWIGDRGSVHEWVASAGFAGRPAAILDLSGQERPQWARRPRPELRYRALPIVNGATIERKSLDSALGYIARALAEGRTVIVHCSAGISRSPGIVAAYLCRHAGMGWREAVEFIRRARPIAAPHPAIEDSVRKALG